MPLRRRRRRVPADQTDLARSRVSALAARHGWVPRVPADVAVGHASEQLWDDSAERLRRSGRHAKPPAGPAANADGAQTDALAGWAAALGEGAPEDAPPHGPVGSAVGDRLPLPVRAVVEGLPPSVRKGQFGLQPAQAAVVVLVVLLGLAVTGLLTGLGRPRVQAIEPAPAATVMATGTPAAVAGEVGTGAADTGPAELVVHVAGKVARPGIVHLQPGSRVVDAIEAAGGAHDGVDLTPLNLARTLSDGEQIVVGIDPPPHVAGDLASPAPSVVNLNTAGPEQLATLPGIGPTLAGRIMQWREQNGRFTAVEELLEVPGIGPAKYEAIADLVSL